MPKFLPFELFSDVRQNYEIFLDVDEFHVFSQLPPSLILQILRTVRLLRTLFRPSLMLEYSGSQRYQDFHFKLSSFRDPSPSHEKWMKRILMFLPELKIHKNDLYFLLVVFYFQFALFGIP